MYVENNFRGIGGMDCCLKVWLMVDAWNEQD